MKVLSSTVSLSSAQSNDCGWKKIHFNSLQLFPRITEHPSPLTAPHNRMQSRSNCRNMLFSLLCFGLNTNHWHVWPFIMPFGIIGTSEAWSDGGSSDTCSETNEGGTSHLLQKVSLQKETNEALCFLIITAHDSMSETNTAEHLKWTIILVGWEGQDSTLMVDSKWWPQRISSLSLWNDQTVTRCEQSLNTLKNSLSLRFHMLMFCNSVDDQYIPQAATYYLHLPLTVFPNVLSKKFPLFSVIHDYWMSISKHHFIQTALKKSNF